MLAAAAAADTACAQASGRTSLGLPSCQFGDYSILAGGSVGVLNLQALRPNELSGQVFGETLSGYHSGRAHVVWVRKDSGGTIRQVYVGSCNTLRYPGGRQAGIIEGTVYAVSAGGGATEQRNAFAFRAAQTGAFVSPQPPRPPAISSTPPLADPEGGWQVVANAHASPLILNVGPQGEVAGWMFDEPIIGHYAKDAGTIAFLRGGARTPSQFYQGRIVGQGHAARLEGEFYALKVSGGASPDRNVFEFSASNRSPFFNVQSAANDTLCFDIYHAQTGGARLLMYNCDSSSAHQHVAFLPPLRQRGSKAAVMRHSGKCLDVAAASEAVDAHINQFRCHGQANQRILVEDESAGYRFRFEHSNLCIGYNPDEPESEIEDTAYVARQIDCSSNYTLFTVDEQ
jgi:hypothetical protein